ncbi:MAG TPA: hypothetical protein VFR32_11820 [Gaiellaceae bacterium]|nr:hypothetical protein [Gaiellaceae bacterium]
MTRAAWYALRSGGWRDYVTLLHLPYTLWHLSYVVIGAALAPLWLPGRLGATLVAFALALGVGAHALDELHGRPLATRIPSGVLWALAAASITAAVAIGVAGAVLWWPWIAAFVAFGGFIVVAYNLELFGGAFHSDLWFALAWGSFPLLTAYAAAAETIRVEAVAAAGFAALLSLAQRRLSTPVRMVRRRVRDVSGSLELDDGESLPITTDLLVRAPEDALRILTAATIALAVALALLRA